MDNRTSNRTAPLLTGWVTTGGIRRWVGERPADEPLKTYTPRIVNYGERQRTRPCPAGCGNKVRPANKTGCWECRRKREILERRRGSLLIESPKFCECGCWLLPGEDCPNCLWKTNETLCKTLWKTNGKDA